MEISQNCVMETELRGNQGIKWYMSIWACWHSSEKKSVFYFPFCCWAKTPWKTQVREERVYFSSDSRLQLPIAGQSQRQHLEAANYTTATVRSRERGDVLYSSSVWVPKLGNVATHGGIGIYTLVRVIKTNYHRHAHRPINTRQPITEISQFILVCGELTINTNDHRAVGLNGSCSSPRISCL